MELPINDKDLATIISALSLGGDARLYHLLKEVIHIMQKILTMVQFLLFISPTM